MYRLAGWRGRPGKCEDEHGNVYEGDELSERIRLQRHTVQIQGRFLKPMFPGDAILAGETRLNPKSKQASFIFFERVRPTWQPKHD